MTAHIDEFTAHRWSRRGEAVCPLCAEEQPQYPMSLTFVRAAEGRFLSCPVHGKLFDVQHAA